MRAEKKFLVAEVNQQVQSSPFVLLTEYAGLSVAQFAELRKRLRNVNAECHVVKNTILRLALTAAGLPVPEDALRGMTAIVIGSNGAEISAAAKVLKEFAKEFNKPKVKAGVMGAQALAAADVLALADLPSLDQLRARLIGLLQAPATKVAVVLSTPAGQLARVLKARADKAASAAAEVAT